jgi:exonuclease III
VQDWVLKERPDVLCLQEIKASPDQIPMFLCELEDYWCYWHGEKGYSGVGLLVRKEFAPERPAFAHPAFDFENRIVTVRTPQATVASVYVPNGGKDFPAKMRFLEALDELAAAYEADALPLIICGDLNATPDSEIIATLESTGFQYAHAGLPQTYTCKVNAEVKMIDYLFHSPEFRAEPQPVVAISDQTALPSAEQPSDHLPIVSRFFWKA